MVCKNETPGRGVAGGLNSNVSASRFDIAHYNGNRSFYNNFDRRGSYARGADGRVHFLRQPGPLSPYSARQARIVGKLHRIADRPAQKCLNTWTPLGEAALGVIKGVDRTPEDGANG